MSCVRDLITTAQVRGDCWFVDPKSVDWEWNAVQILMGKVNAWRSVLEGKFLQKGQML